jgi:response regulator RpfG family c-di-GMP phosphodiesterase
VLGSTFYFSIPYNRVIEEQPNNGIANRAEIDEGRPTGLKILIVEDDETSALFIAAMIRKICSTILFAQTGREAVASRLTLP